MSVAYHEWWNEYQLAIRKKEKRRRKQLAGLVAIIAYRLFIKKRAYSQKRFWVNPLFTLRSQFGFYEAIFPTLANIDVNFRDYMRMSVAQFEELLAKVGPLITKSHVVRTPIPAAARLAMTLRYLATGDCITSTSYSYLVGITTARTIIKETCEVIGKVLTKEVLPAELSKEEWLRIAKGFELQWNFPNCVGSIDGKHIAIQCPDGACSEYFNYKHFHSIVLLAVCDADHNFTLVDIGARGRRSDGGIFRNSKMGFKFWNNLMNLPNPRKIAADGSPLPYMLVGDEAFASTNFLLRPYPGKDLITEEQLRIFNYRLSRARLTIENSFGILVSRWRVLKKPIVSCVSNIKSMVNALVCLHNWLGRVDNEYMPREINNENLRSEVEDSVLQERHYYQNNNSTRVALDIRKEFCKYFNQEGAVYWQYEIDF